MTYIDSSSIERPEQPDNESEGRIDLSLLETGELELTRDELLHELFTAQHIINSQGSGVTAGAIEYRDELAALINARSN